MLQESDLERTEPASPRRLEQAREEGRIARSVELSAFAVLLAGVCGLWVMGPSIMGDLSALLLQGMRFERALAFDPHVLSARLAYQISNALLAISPLLAIVFAAALLAPLFLNGWVFTLKTIQPDFQRLNPWSGFGRMFSGRGLVELAKAVAKAAVIGGAVVWLLWHKKEAMVSLAAQSVHSGIGATGALAIMSLLAIVAALIPIVAIDVPFQLWDHRRKLRMTREELRQETKETEGDPQVKARIRSLQRERARRRMMAEVPKADVVITNPGHYAVALRYSADRMRAPRIVAKGVHRLALKIREIAEEHRVPVVEAPPLARALYHHADLGDEIPQSLYAAVAEVLAYVYQLRHYSEYGGIAPRMPQRLPVPPDLDPENRAAGTAFDRTADI
jgi:flagellar biosynthetic protein FlhB